MPTKALIVSQFRYSRFTVEDYNRDVALMERVDRSPYITFNPFRHVAKQQGWTAEHLAQLAHGHIDDPKRTVDRILKGAHVNGRWESSADTVIPWSCLIDLYLRTSRPEPALAGEKSCACGCEGKVRGKQKFSTPACQRRAYRQHHPTQPVKSASNG